MRIFTSLILTLILTIDSAGASGQVSSYSVSGTNLKLQINSLSLPLIQVKGTNSERGAALTVLTTGEYLFGGGVNGNQLFSFDPQTRQLKTLGEVYSQRVTNDARFAITDLEILSQQENKIVLLASYPKLENTNCVRLYVDRIELDLDSANFENIENWYQSNPCVPISAVQHASGRLVKIDSESAYITIGDFGFRQIGNRDARGDLGSIIKISASKIEKISIGHRNAQGLVLYRQRYLVSSEHGPRGGDELNLIKPNSDYGWPFVTWGEAYSPGDYVVPGKANTHQGFEKPLMYWAPSIAPTDLVEIPKNSQWNRFAGQLMMGTLREESLVRIALSNDIKPIAQDIIKVNERIRALEVAPNGKLIASTDSGKILEIEPN